MSTRDFNAKVAALIEVEGNKHTYEVLEYDRPMCYASSDLGSNDVLVPLDFAEENHMWKTVNKAPGFRFALAYIGGCFFSVQEVVDFLEINMHYTIKNIILEY